MKELKDLNPEDVWLEPPVDELTLQFMGDSKEVARLYIENGVLCFEGDMNKAAESFFDLLKPMVEEYIEAELKKRRQYLGGTK